MRTSTACQLPAALLGVLLLVASCGGPSTSRHSSSDSSSRGSAASGPSLQKAWSTDTSLRTPESVLWDSARKIFYVSNVNGGSADRDGNGFISQMAPGGKIVKLRWVTGLDAPKGLALHGNYLYAADLDSLVMIDVSTGKIKMKIFIPGSTFLNDLAADSAGNVYMSDTRQGKVFCYGDGKISIYTGVPEMEGANGLLWRHGNLLINTAGGIYAYDSATRKSGLFCGDVKGGDGLTALDDSEEMASRWAGEIYEVDAQGKGSRLLDTRSENKNTADILYMPDSSLLLVPTFNGNTVDAYRFLK
jgi:hypothetical protein